MRWIAAGALMMLLVPAEAHAQDCEQIAKYQEYDCQEGMRCRTWVSSPKLSGMHKAFSEYYCVETKPVAAPKGYAFSNAHLKVVGDRSCLTFDDSPNVQPHPFLAGRKIKNALPKDAQWAECGLTDYGESVTRGLFRLQGHDEVCPPDWARVIEVGYKDITARVTCSSDGRRESVGVLTVFYRRQ